GLLLGLHRDVPDRQRDDLAAGLLVQLRPVDDRRLVWVVGLQELVAEQREVRLAPQPEAFAGRRRWRDGLGIVGEGGGAHGPFLAAVTRSPQRPPASRRWPPPPRGPPATSAPPARRRSRTPPPRPRTRRRSPGAGKAPRALPAGAVRCRPRAPPSYAP